MGHFGAQKHPTEEAAQECRERGFKWGDLFHSTQSVSDSLNHRGGQTNPH